MSQPFAKYSLVRFHSSFTVLKPIVIILRSFSVQVALSTATCNMASTSITLQFQIQLSCLSILSFGILKDYFKYVDIFQ